MKTIKVKLDGHTAITVDRKAYVKAKVKQLKEFGYSDLTPEHVDEQIDALLAGKELGKGLTVIGGFMRDEVVIEPKTP